jgi:CXXC-20-CXXC protein
MDTCKKCNQKFNYWQVYNNYWSAKEKIQCLNCATTHDHKFMNRLLLAAVIFLAGIAHTAIPLQYLPDGISFLVISIFIYVPIAFVMSLLTNWLFRFKLSKEYTKQ